MDQPTTTNSPRSYALVIGVALFTIIADQISKRVILGAFQPGELRPVIPDFFNLTLTYNRGAAFGLWGDLPPGWREAALGVSILLALAVVFFFLKQPMYQNAMGRISLAGILGGALGNVIDRFTYGAVVDFLDVYVGTYHWPAFNVADSAITLGVVALILMPQKKAHTQIETKERL